MSKLIVGLIFVIVVVLVLCVSCVPSTQTMTTTAPAITTTLPGVTMTSTTTTTIPATAATEIQTVTQPPETVTVTLTPARTLKDPTYDQAVAFMAEDQTEQQVSNDYALATIIVINNAAQKGIMAYWVVAGQNRGYVFGIILVGFHTTDRGWIYFMASFPPVNADHEVILELGQQFTKLNPWYSAVLYDDTITMIYYWPQVN